VCRGFETSSHIGNFRADRKAGAESVLVFDVECLAINGRIADEL
jgi:hypothetical protein